MVLTGICAWIFYDSIAGIVLFLPIWLLSEKLILTWKKQKFRTRFLEEYREFLEGLGASLSGGLSVEKAFFHEEEELYLMFGDKSVLLPEIRNINKKISLNIPVEKAFSEFAEKIDIDDVGKFADVFSFAKRNGGDYTRVISHTGELIGNRIGLEQEIMAENAEKRLEVRVMSVIPAGVLIFLKLDSGEFLTPLYHNFQGIMLMTGALLIYAGSLYLSFKIIKSGRI